MTIFEKNLVQNIHLHVGSFKHGRQLPLGCLIRKNSEDGLLPIMDFMGRQGVPFQNGGV